MGEMDGGGWTLSMNDIDEIIYFIINYKKRLMTYVRVVMSGNPWHYLSI